MERLSEEERGVKSPPPINIQYTLLLEVLNISPPHTSEMKTKKTHQNKSCYTEMFFFFLSL